MMCGKYKKIFLILIILLGVILRFYGAMLAPKTWDEIDGCELAESLFINNNDISFEDIEPAPIFPLYIVRFGWSIFGQSKLGTRLPFVIIGIITLVIVFLFTKEYLGSNTALIATALLSVSQYHLAYTRVADCAFLFFIGMLSLFAFYKGLNSNSRKWIVLAGFITGIGVLIKENMLFFIPINFIFLLSSQCYRKWLKDKSIWAFFMIVLFFALPIIYINSNSGWPRATYIQDVACFGPSLNAIGLYLGELFLLLIKPFSKLFNYLVWQMDSEFPMVNFVFGFTILVSVGVSLKTKHHFIKLLLICFLFNFAVFSFIRPCSTTDSVFSFAALDWACLGFIPGVIISAHVLNNFLKEKKRKRYLRRAFFLFLILYMVFRTWNFATFPLNCFFPAEEFCIQRQFRLVEEYIKELNDVELVKARLKKVIKATKNKPLYKKYKKGGALKLAEIYVKEGDYEMGRRYLSYVLEHSIDEYLSDNVNITKVIDNLKNKWPTYYLEPQRYDFLDFTRALQQD